MRCAGLLLAAERGRAGEAYFLTDGAPITFRSYLSELLASSGHDVSRAPSIPLPIARVLAVLMEAFWRVTHRTGEPPLTRTTVALIGSQVTVSDDKARRELGYQPVISREQGLRELRADV